MCILRFHARAGYLQHYQTLLKELNSHLPDDAGPQDEPASEDQYAVERVTLADRNHNLPSETGLRYPSLVAMYNRHLLTSRISVAIQTYILKLTYMYVV